MMKILILDDNTALLKRLVVNIKEFEAIPANNIEEALSILKTQDISFIAVDYDLGNSKTGDMLYGLLYEYGKSIPAIVFSGKELSQAAQSYLSEKGFSKILSKIDDEESVSDLIEKAAKKILDSCKERAYHILKKVEHMGIGNHPIPFDKYVKTINEWIKMMIDCKLNLEQEKQLKEVIIEHCKIYEVDQGMFRRY